MSAPRKTSCPECGAPVAYSGTGRRPFCPPCRAKNRQATFAKQRAQRVAQAGLAAIHEAAK